MRRAMIVVVVAGLVALSLAAGGPMGGQTGQIGSLADTRAFTERFLTTLEKARAFDAYQLVRTAVNDPQTDVDNMRNIAEQIITNARNTYGPSIGHELINTQTLGESFVRYDYLFRLERSALHFRVTFYKSRNRYIPVDMYFEEELEQLFYEFGKPPGRN